MSEERDSVNPGERRRRDALAELGLRMENSHRLHDALAGSLSVEEGGFPQFRGILTPRLRAVASDLVLTAADAVEANLTEAALHAQAYDEYVGPNGRTMPGPGSTPADDLATVRGESEVVAFFRALGSTLDCLSATVIGVLRLPSPIQRADASLVAGGLDRLLDDGFDSADRQLDRCRRVGDLLRRHRAEPPGWLEWVVEMRNRVVHRGRQLNTWLPRPPAGGGTRLLVRSEQDPAYLMRFEPHLRRNPWLAEMETLGREESVQAQWLAEPAPRTMDNLLSRMNDVAEDVSDVLTDCWELPLEHTADWVLPEAAWATAEAGPAWRIELADQFEGFDRGYEVPPLSALRVSRRDGVRLQIAERLRRDDR